MGEGKERLTRSLGRWTLPYEEEVAMKLVAKVDVQALPAPIHEAYFKFVQTFWDHGLLDPQVKELIRMRSAINADCKQ